MTTEILTLAVGTHAAARLIALKSRLGDTPEARAAELMEVSSMGLKVTVVKVETGTPLDYAEFDCGHAILIEHDEPNASLVGAETVCERAHK